MRVALPAYAALIPFSGLLAVGSSKLGSLSSLLGLVLLLGLALQLFLRSGVSDVRLSPTLPVWLLLLGVSGITIVWSLAPGATANSVLILASLVFIYALVALAPADRDVLRRVENGLLAGGAIVVFYGLYQLVWLGGFPSDPPVPGATDGRFGNDLLGPNNQAAAFMLPLVISLTRAVTLEDRNKRRFNTGLAGLYLLGVLMTGSRGGLLSTIVAVGVLLAVSSQGRKTLAQFAAVGLVVAGSVFFLHPFGLAERTVETTSSSGRTDIWRVALAACPEYCPAGSGWGTFREVYADTQASVADARVLAGSGNYEPHNVWLLAVIELGVPGLLLLLTGLLLTVLEAWRLPVGLRGPPLAALAATITAAFFLSNLEFKFFWMSLMFVALARNVAQAEAKAPAVTEPGKPTPAGVA
jgi:O-antigen ligase